jgi:hypothetical protein
MAQGQTRVGQVKPSRVTIRSCLFWAVMLTRLAEPLSFATTEMGHNNGAQGPS